MTTGTAEDLAALRRVLASVRRRRLWVVFGTLVGMLAVGAIGFLATVMLVDAVVELPYLVRAALLTAGAIAMGLAVFRHVLRGPLAACDDDAVALWVEADQPGLRQRLISSIQLARLLEGTASVATRDLATTATEPTTAHEAAGLAGSSSASPELVRALISETRTVLEPADLSTVTPAEGLYVWGVGGAGAVLLLTIVLGLGGEPMTRRMLRALAVPGVELPTRTSVELLAPTQQVLARGDDLLIEARAQGVVPKAGRLTVTLAGGGTRVYTLPRTDDPATRPDDVVGVPGRFATTLRNLTESFSFVVTLNDGRSPRMDIRVVPRPVARRVWVTVQPPPYIGGDPKRQQAGELRVLEGSRLSVLAESSKPLSPSPTPGRLMLLGGSGFPRELPMRRTASEATDATGPTVTADDVLAVPTLRGLAVVLRDADGLETVDPRVFPVEVVADAPPRVRVLSPSRRDDVGTRRATLLLRYEADDDLGLAAVRLRYAVLPPASAPATSASPRRAEPVDSPSATDAPDGLEAVAAVRELPVGTGERQAAGELALNVAELAVTGPSGSAGSGASNPPGQPLASRAAESALREGSQIVWWLEAVDINTVTGPGIARSPRFTLRIASEAEVRDVLMNRLGSIVGDLETARGVQEDAARTLGSLLIERPLRPSSPGGTAAPRDPQRPPGTPDNHPGGTLPSPGGTP